MTPRKRLQLGMGKVAQPLRVAITGTQVSPDIAHTVYLAGQSQALARIDAALDRHRGLSRRSAATIIRPCPSTPASIPSITSTIPESFVAAVELRASNAVCA